MGSSLIFGKNEHNDPCQLKKSGFRRRRKNIEIRGNPKLIVVTDEFFITGISFKEFNKIVNVECFRNCFFEKSDGTVAFLFSNHDVRLGKIETENNSDARQRHKVYKNEQNNNASEVLHLEIFRHKYINSCLISQEHYRFIVLNFAKIKI